MFRFVQQLSKSSTSRTFSTLASKSSKVASASLTKNVVLLTASALAGGSVVYYYNNNNNNNKFATTLSSFANSVLPSSTALVYAASQKVSPLITEADQLYKDGEMEKLYKLLSSKITNGKGENAEVTWRAARAAKEMALLAKDAEQKKKFVYEAYNLAKAALEQDENNFACHKWVGITISEVGDYEGIKVKISNAFTIKTHFDKAVELNPKDGTSRHLVGMWCFTFADMPWYQRKIASALFASPPTATYEEALDHFLAAEKVEPNFYSKNTLMIGKIYTRLNDKEKAKFWLEKAKNMPVANPSDQEAHDEAVTLLKQL